MLCSKLHCHTDFKLKLFSHEIGFDVTAGTKLHMPVLKKVVLPLLARNVIQHSSSFLGIRPRVGWPEWQQTLGILPLVGWPEWHYKGLDPQIISVHLKLTFMPGHKGKFQSAMFFFSSYTSTLVDRWLWVVVPRASSALVLPLPVTWYCTLL